jgi:hypothetical protein
MASLQRRRLPRTVGLIRPPPRRLLFVLYNYHTHLCKNHDFRTSTRSLILLYLPGAKVRCRMAV